MYVIIDKNNSVMIHYVWRDSRSTHNWVRCELRILTCYNNDKVYNLISDSKLLYIYSMGIYTLFIYFFFPKFVLDINVSSPLLRTLYDGDKNT